MARFYIYDGSKYVPASADTLTFTGAVTDSYDGSNPVSVEIPSGTTYIAVNSTSDVISTVNGETYADIQALIDASKPVVVRYDVLDFYYFETFEFSDSSGTHRRLNFRCDMGSIVYTLALRDDNTWVFSQTDLQTSSITDTGGYFTTDTVEGALQEIGAGLAGAVKSVNGQTGVVTLNANDISTTKLPPTNILNFVIDGAFDEGLVELTRNGASASANDFISAINSGSTVTVGLNDQGNPKVTFKDAPVKYKITGNTLSLCFIAEKGHTYTPAIYVLSGPTSGTGVSNLVEHRFTDSLYQENYVSANDLPVQAPLTVEEYLEELESRIAALQSKSITDSGGHFTTDTVEGALQEIGAELAGINTLLGSGIQISFTIDDGGSNSETFSVVSGTTWAEWIGTGRLIFNDSLVLYIYGGVVATEAGVYAVSLDGSTAVSGGDEIVSGATYTIINWGG